MTDGRDPDARSREIDAELRFHHEQTMAELRRQGLSEDAAHREAMQRFGDAAAWKKRILRVDSPRAPLGRRATRAVVEGTCALARDVRYGFRSLLRDRLFTLSTIGVFALGLGATSVVLGLVYGILISPLPYPDPDRLVYIWGRNAAVRAGYLNLPVSEPDLADWRAHAVSFVAAGGAIPHAVTLTGAGDPARLSGIAVVGNLFEVLQVPPMFGRSLTPRDSDQGARPAVVLGFGAWQRQFGGDPGAIGRTVQLDGQLHEIVGVMPDGFAFPRTQEVSSHYGFASQIDVYLPWRTGAAGPAVRGNRYILAAARLRSAVSIADAEREIAAITPDSIRTDSFALVPFADQAVSAVRTSLLLLSAAVAAVLGIACLNIAHLLLVRVRARRHEFAIRASLGAGRAGLVRQILVESALLAGIGGLAALVWSSWLLNGLVSVAPPDLPRLDAVTMNAGVAIASFVVMLVCGLGVGSVAALSLRTRHLAPELRSRARGLSEASGRSNRIMVGLEVGLSVLLMLCAGLLARSLWRVVTTSPGFDAKSAITFQVSLPEHRYPTGEDVRRGYDAMLAEITAIDGVRAAAYTWQLPMSGIHGSTSYQRESGESGMALIHRVSAGYFAAMGMRLVRGRGLDTDSDLPALVVNEALARTQWPGADPIGQTVTVNTVRSRIVGVVSDVRHGSLEQAPGAEMYRLARLRTMFLIVRTSASPAVILPAVRKAVAAVDPAVPLSDVQTLEDRLAHTTARREFTVAMIVVFAGLATGLALVGLYGVMAMIVTRRRREVGVRMALGATPSSAVILLLRQTTPAIAGGLIGGTLVAVALSRHLGAFLYETSPLDPATYASVLLALTAASLLAIYLPGRRAARIDPASVLKADS